MTDKIDLKIPIKYLDLPYTKVHIHNYRRRSKIKNLKRPDRTAYFIVTKYDGMHWHLHEPKGKDPHMFERLKPYFNEIAKAGSTAASSNELSQSVISKLNKKVNLPNVETGFEFYERLGPRRDVIAAVSFQINSFPFNDGAAIWINDRLIDCPNKCANMHPHYLDQTRTALAITNDNQNTYFISENGNQMSQELQKNNIKYAIFAAPQFIVNNKVRDLKEILTSDFFGDARHYLRTPYTQDSKNNGPVMAAEFVEAFRQKRGSEIYDSLTNKIPITFKLINSNYENGYDSILKAFAKDPLFGEKFARQIKISLKTQEITLPYLMPACFNHTLTGIDRNGNIYTVHIPGQRDLFKKNVYYSGWDGATISEIIDISKEVFEMYKLVILFDSNHGRDPSAFTLATEEMIQNHTFLVANQDKELSMFLSGGIPPKIANTSPQQMLVCIK